jgi:hypothetical protein
MPMAGDARLGTMAKWGAAGVALGIAVYGVYARAAWLRYGHIEPASGDDADAELDRFMSRYDVVERHHIGVEAPAALTLAAACELDMLCSPVVRAIFKGRELLLGSTPDTSERPREFLALVKSLGWGVLSEKAGREVVIGAVTQPWKADVVFRSLPAAEFAEFNEPGFVKIAWTLRADPMADDASVFRTETRAIATDETARAKFRRYWSLLSPGIILIRRATLGPVRDEAERRARIAARRSTAGFDTAPLAYR